jgi:hypothetical protein
MRVPRTMVPIPQKLAAGIDKIGGAKRRTRFIVEILEQEIQRREQLAALQEAAGCWKDEDHPELANGSDAFVKGMRDEGARRLEKIQREASE